MSFFPRLVLACLAIAFLPVGFLGWFAPDILFAPIGVQISDAAGYAEIRAAYGGHFTGAGLFFALGTAKEHYRDTALTLGAVILGGFVFGRLLSMVIEGVPSAVALFTLTIETVGLTASLSALGIRRGQPSEA